MQISKVIRIALPGAVNAYALRTGIGAILVDTGYPGSAYELKKILNVQVAIHAADADVLISGVDYPVRPLKPTAMLLSRILKGKIRKRNSMIIP